MLSSLRAFTQEISCRITLQVNDQFTLTPLTLLTITDALSSTHTTIHNNDKCIIFIMILISDGGC